MQAQRVHHFTVQLFCDTLDDAYDDDCDTCFDNNCAHLCTLARSCVCATVVGGALTRAQDSTDKRSDASTSAAVAPAAAAVAANFASAHAHHRTIKLSSAIERTNAHKIGARVVVHQI